MEVVGVHGKGHGCSPGRVGLGVQDWQEVFLFLLYCVAQNTSKRILKDDGFRELASIV